MKRPATRNAGSKPIAKPVTKTTKKLPSNVVPLLQKKQKVSKPTSPKRKTVFQKPRRAMDSKVAKFRPKVSFGRKIVFSVIAAVAALSIFVGFAVFSPLLAVRKIEIVGAHLVSEKEIERDLKFLIGKPLPQITNEEVASKLSKYELIDSVSVVSAPPETLKVVVVERSAIATVIINNVRYLYDPVGVQLGRAGSNDGYPVVIGAGDPATSKTYASAIDVLLSVPMWLLPKLDSVKASSKDNVVLGLKRNSQQILWGDDSQPGLKAKVLSALMDHYPSRVGLIFDVSSPSQPSVY